MIEAIRYEYHWHVVRHADDDDRLSTYSLLSAVDYAATEVSWMAESEHEVITIHGECGMFEEAYNAFVKSEDLSATAANLANAVRQADPDRAKRAPHYRDEEAQGPLWTIMAERVAEEANASVGGGFQFYRCVCGDCRPGAWVVTVDGERTVTPYGAGDPYSASSYYMDAVIGWAERSDEDYDAMRESEEDGSELGSDVAAVQGMLFDGDGPRDNQPHHITLHANDGSTVEFSLVFDPESDLAES